MTNNQLTELAGIVKRGKWWAERIEQLETVLAALQRGCEAELHIHAATSKVMLIDSPGGTIHANTVVIVMSELTAARKAFAELKGAAGDPA